MQPAKRKRGILLVCAMLVASLGALAGLVQEKGGATPSPGTPAQQSPIAEKPDSAGNTPEMTSQDEAANFKVNVRLVEVHVVVRDSQGKTIGALHKEDFQLFDDRKPQVITKFSVQRPGLQVQREEQTSRPVGSSVATETTSSPPPDISERYVAYVFDDVHLEFSDLARAREAAEKNLATLQPTDRAAIFTISGQNNLDFTDDRAKLRDALRRLMPRPISVGRVNDCPKMGYYIADLIQNKNDPQALTAVTADVLDCQFNDDPKYQSQAQSMAQMAAAQGLTEGEAETHLALTSLKDVVRRMSGVPGQRCMVLVSPGFITPQQEYDLDNLIDRATRANITMSAIDARGLYVVVPGGDISQRIQRNTAVAGIEELYRIASASADADVMAELADATGGEFFQNNNDLAQGFRRVASTPEYYYVLAFSPQNVKLNGRFHNLKVTLRTAEKYSVQARRGYLAPKQASGPEQEAKQEIEDALFSQEEMHDLPIDLHTQFFKPSAGEAKLTVLAHIDVRNGNLVTGIAKTLQMHLKDETLANQMGPGLNVKTNFDVKPGSYLVRLVVRDAEGQIAAENGAIQIP
ncbi:MAG: hypothetical protein DMG92_06265 [Acidobacteria bacterium]|nr:MAG: hypothetical protein DMG92_06265 [Acidobacteriota bacterium]